MKPLVSQLWPQFMADPAFAAAFGSVLVDRAEMFRADKKIIFTLQSSAPLDKGLCARLLASLEPEFPGFELKIRNLFGYAHLDEAALLELTEELKGEGIPINGCAVVTVNAETSGLFGTLQDLLEQIDQVAGVLRGEVLAG